MKLNSKSATARVPEMFRGVASVMSVERDEEFAAALVSMTPKRMDLMSIPFAAAVATSSLNSALLVAVAVAVAAARTPGMRAEGRLRAASCGQAGGA